MMLLTSCASIEIPADWLKDCPVTYLPDGPATNAAIIKLAVDREFDVKRCNVDKAALREFVKSHPKVRMKN